MLSSHPTLRAWFFAQPILLLCLTALFWAGNTIAGRLAIDQVSPLAVVFLRWVAVSGIMVALSFVELMPECLEALSPREMGFGCMGGMLFMFLSKSMSKELTGYFA